MAIDTRYLATLFRGVGNPTRARLLNLLVAGELCVCDLVALIGSPQATVSRHLGALRRAGLTETTRRGRFSYYRLARPANPAHRATLAAARRSFEAVPRLVRERAEAAARVRARVQAPC